MRINITNFSAIIANTAEASRVIVATVDVIRNGAFALLRLSAHLWHSSAHGKCAHDALKPTHPAIKPLSWLGNLSLANYLALGRLLGYVHSDSVYSDSGFMTSGSQAGFAETMGQSCRSHERCRTSLALLGGSNS